MVEVSIVVGFEYVDEKEVAHAGCAAVERVVVYVAAAGSVIAIVAVEQCKHGGHAERQGSPSSEVRLLHL